MQNLGPRRLNRALNRNLLDKGGVVGVFASAPLDLRFALQKTLDPRVTFTRASSGTFVGSDGLIKTAATNEPRFDHNPTTGESLGLLVEEARTNSVTNNTMVGAVAGTPGTIPTGWIYATTSSNGLTLSIVGTGIENGINYIDYRFNGTTVASPVACAIGLANATASTGQTWTASTYWKLVGGTTTGVTGWNIGIIESTSGNSFVTGAFYSQTAPTSAALITQRPAATRTLSGGATVGIVTYPFNFAVAGNTAIDFTIRIGLPQLEQGAFATSVIPTTTATVTRAADVASITGSNFSSWYRQDQSTWYSEVNNQVLSTDKRIVWVTDSTNTPSYGLRMPNNNTFQMGAFNSGTFSVTSPGTVTVGLMKQAGAIASNDIASVANGLAVGTSSTWTLFTADKVRLGADTSGTACVNGTIKRLTYWPTRLANTTLQQITQP